MQHTARLNVLSVCLALVLATSSCSEPGDTPQHGAGTPGAAGDSTPEPNLIWISIDGLRADHAGTPALERLSKDGHRFTGVYAHAPSSLPSHAALFTSHRPLETGTLAGARTISAEMPVLAEWLAGQGYRTAAVFADRALLADDPARGLQRGFETVSLASDLEPPSDAQQVLAVTLDRLDELEEGDGPFFLFVQLSDPQLPYRAHGTSPETAEVFIDGEAQLSIPILENRPFLADFTMGTGDHVIEVKSILPLTVRHLRASIRLDGQSDFVFEAEPGERELVVTNVGPDPLDFRVDLWAHDAPDPATAPDRYGLEVEHADQVLGALIDQLERKGLYDDSLVVVTSPNGQALGEHGHIGARATLFDELLATPAVLKLPSGHPKEAEVERARDKYLRQIDLAPTLLELLGQPELPRQIGTTALEGTYRVLVSSTHPPEAPAHLYSLRSDTLKLLFHPDEDRFEMFDLVQDPGETADVYAERGAEVSDWKQALRSAHELVLGMNPSSGGE